MNSDNLRKTMQRWPMINFTAQYNLGWSCREIWLPFYGLTQHSDMIRGKPCSWNTFSRNIKKSNTFFERDIRDKTFERFRTASRGAMKDYEIVVGSFIPNNSAIKSTMKLSDAVLESLSHALSPNHSRFWFPSWNPEKLASKVVELDYVC